MFTLAIKRYGDFVIINIKDDMIEQNTVYLEETPRFAICFSEHYIE